MVFPCSHEIESNAYAHRSRYNLRLAKMRSLRNTRWPNCIPGRYEWIIFGRGSWHTPENNNTITIWPTICRWNNDVVGRRVSAVTVGNITGNWWTRDTKHYWLELLIIIWSIFEMVCRTTDLSHVLPLHTDKLSEFAFRQLVYLVPTYCSISFSKMIGKVCVEKLQFCYIREDV